MPRRVFLQEIPRNLHGDGKYPARDVPQVAGNAMTGLQARYSVHGGLVSPKSRCPLRFGAFGQSVSYLTGFVPGDPGKGVCVRRVGIGFDRRIRMPSGGLLRDATQGEAGICKAGAGPIARHGPRREGGAVERQLPLRSNRPAEFQRTFVDPASSHPPQRTETCPATIRTMSVSAGIRRVVPGRGLFATMPDIPGIAAGDIRMGCEPLGRSISVRAAYTGRVWFATIGS